MKDAKIGEFGLGDLKSGSLLPSQPTVGVFIFRKHFQLGVPRQNSVFFHGNVPKVACAYASMLAFDVRNGGLSGLDTIEEIPHVVDDRIEFACPLRTFLVIEVVNVHVFAIQRVLLEFLDGLP